MQIKTTMRHHITQSEWLKLTTQETTDVDEERKGNPLTLLVEMQTGTATLENSMEFPQEVKNRATLPPCNCCTRYLPPKIQMQ